MAGGVGDDFTRVGGDFSGLVEGRAADGDEDNDGLKEEGADEPADDGKAGVALRAGGEELLIHDLVAEHEEHGGDQELHGADEGEVAKHLEVGGRQRGMQAGPSAGVGEEQGRGNDADDGDERADGDIHIGHRRHAGQRGGDNNEGRDDEGAELGGDGVREDEVEDVSAALELIAGDADVGEEDGDGAKDAGGLVVAGFEQIGEGKTRETPGARSDEVDKQQADPAAGRLPESGETVAVGVFGSGKEGAGADPGSEKREDQDHGGQGAAGDEVVGLGFDEQGAGDRNGQQHGNNDGQNGYIEGWHPQSSSPVKGCTECSGWKQVCGRGVTGGTRLAQAQLTLCEGVAKL